MNQVRSHGSEDLPVGEELSEVLRQYTDVARRLHQSHESLQREVLRLRGELASKDEELERRRRLAALGELAAGVAHEVRNPLGAIQLYSGLLRSRLADENAALELLEKIDTGIKAIDAVVRDTLSLVPRQGRLCPREVAALVGEAADVCAPALRNRGITLEVETGDPTLCVLADGEGLQRVLVNLIVNAAEASAPGSRVSVEVAAVAAESGGRDTHPTRSAGRDVRPGNAARDAQPAPQQVELCVRDQGSGLSDDVLDHMFDPFFTTKEHGTGLGLTIAHRLVEAHGGSLRAANRAAGGAEFIVSLPLADGAAAISRAAPAQRSHTAA